MSLANGILKIDELRRHVLNQKRLLNDYVDKSIEGGEKYESQIMDITVNIVALLRTITQVEKEMKDDFVDGFSDNIKKLMN